MPIFQAFFKSPGASSVPIEITSNTPVERDIPEFERSTDPLDQATDLAERERRYSLAAIRERSAYQPAPMIDTDEAGIEHRYCLTCGDEIPVERIARMANAVRCVPCESKRESRNNIANGRGGVLNYGE